MNAYHEIQDISPAAVPACGPGAGDCRLLFVSDDAGECASIAANLASRMGANWLQAECAGFTREAANPWVDPQLAELIQAQGIFLQAAYPQLLSTLLPAVADQCHDGIVLIRSNYGPDFPPLFRRLVYPLVDRAAFSQRWEVPCLRPGLLPARHLPERVAEAIAELRDNVAWLMALLEEQLQVA